MEPTAAQAALLQTADALYQRVDLTGSTTDPGNQRGALHAALGEPSGRRTYGQSRLTSTGQRFVPSRSPDKKAARRCPTPVMKGKARRARSAALAALGLQATATGAATPTAMAPPPGTPVLALGEAAGPPAEPGTHVAILASAGTGPALLRKVKMASVADVALESEVQPLDPGGDQHMFSDYLADGRLAAH